jgi:hypothetical protein
MLSASSPIRLSQSLEFVGRTRQMRMRTLRQEDVQVGLGTRSLCTKKAECHRQDARHFQAHLFLRSFQALIESQLTCGIAEYQMLSRDVQRW